MGRMGRCIWNFFHISCNVSYFARGFSTKVTKYNLLVHVHVVCRYTCLWRVLFMAWLGCLWTSSFMCSLSWTSWYNFFFVLATMQGRTTLSAYPHQPCFVNVAIGHPKKKKTRLKTLTNATIDLTYSHVFCKHG